MRRMLLCAAVVLCCSTANAQWGVTLGPGINPELDDWYANWSAVQNGKLCRVDATPLMSTQCNNDLLAIMRAHPPIVTGSTFNNRTVTYHPAYLEAQFLMGWRWIWPRYQP